MYIVLYNSVKQHAGTSRSQWTCPASFTTSLPASGNHHSDGRCLGSVQFCESCHNRFHMQREHVPDLSFCAWLTSLGIVTFQLHPGYKFHSVREPHAPYPLISMETGVVSMPGLSSKHRGTDVSLVYDSLPFTFTLGWGCWITGTL